MTDGTHTHWRMTINNYDETDVALIQQGYADHIRQLVYTFEEGEDGTPHIQAYIKMKRDCRLSHIRKLFPRGNFGYLDSSEYRLNSQRYAQKLDSTARSPAVITNGDPIHTIEGMVRRVILHLIEHQEDIDDLDKARHIAERELVLVDFTVAKIFVSTTYLSMWKQFGHEMYKSVFETWLVESSVHTHTHTHTPEIVPRQEDIQDAEDEDGSGSSRDGGSCSEDSSGDSADDGSSEEGSSSSDCSCG